MDLIDSLASALVDGSIPEGFNEKFLKKLQRKCQQFENRRVVHIYPLRYLTYGDSYYVVFACPVRGAELDDAALAQMKVAAGDLELGTIRYNSVCSYYDIDSDTGRYIEVQDDVQEFSNEFDGVLIFARIFMNSLNAMANAAVDSHYAVIGTDRQTHSHHVELVPNKALGLPRSEYVFENGEKLAAEEESPVAAKIRSAATVLSVVITIAVLVWYFFFK